MASRPVPRLQDASAPPGLRQFSAADPAAEASWHPPEECLSMADFVAAGGWPPEEERVAEPLIINEPIAPPQATFHHVRPGPESGQPQFHPDLKNVVCTSMSRGDVQVLSNRRALEKSHADGTRQIVKATGQTWTLTKYVWDDGTVKDLTRDIVSVYIPLKDFDCSVLNKNTVFVQFEERGLDVKVSFTDGNFARLKMTKLFDCIVPEECKYRVDTPGKRVILKLKKKLKEGETATTKWTGLVEGYHSMPVKGHQIGKSLLRPEKWDEELIDIEHLRNWHGKPRYDMYGSDTDGYKRKDHDEKKTPEFSSVRY